MHHGRDFIFLDTENWNVTDGEKYFHAPTSWIKRFSQFGCYVDEYPDEMPYIHFY